MKALKTIIISAVLFLGLQSQTFAIDEQEDMGLMQQAKPGFAEIPIELQVHIFSFLDQKDFLRASLVCQSWRDGAHLVRKEKTLDLSDRKLDLKDCQALLQVPFSSLILQRCQLEVLTLSQSLGFKERNLIQFMLDTVS